LVKKFDGKVINARFITALKKTGLDAYISNDTLEVTDLNMSYNDRVIVYFNLPRNAESRWDASVFIKENEGHIILWKENIKKVKKSIQEVSGLVKRWNDIVSEIERFQKELNVLTVSSIFNTPFISNRREL
jgi:DNA primase catalytic subunit